ncbi:MAG: diguanylate cyclase, partial [Marinobacter sp.]
AIALTVVVVSLINMAISRQELKRQARDQVSMVAEVISHELDRKLIERFGILTEAAHSVRMDARSFEQFSGLIIERQRPLAHLFENLFLFDEQGRVLHSYPEVRGLAGTDLSDRPYFRQTVGQLTPQVSEPFSSFMRQLPTVMMTAPVFDHDGALVGVLAGSVVLSSDNFLSEVRNTRIGRAGYISVVSRSGLMLVEKGSMHGIRTVSIGNEAALAGMEDFEGVTEGTSRDGERAMVAIQQLNMAPWFVAATWPLDDAYAPANRLGTELAWITGMIVLLALPIAFYLSRRYLNPLGELAEQIRQRHLGVREQPVDATGYHEIRELAATFNHVLADREEVEARLRSEQQRADSILGALQEGVVMTDPMGVIRYANPAAEAFLGHAGQLVGARLFDLASFETEDEPWHAASFLDSEEIHSMDGVIRNDRGLTLEVEITMLHISRGEPDERLVFVIRDDSERRRQEQQLSWQATHDSLTGLLNRRAFSAELVKWLAQAATLEVPTVLMLIDLDYFKPVNDQGGHLLGDEMLRKLAQVFRQAVRKTDAVARFGGDEFAILLPACGLERGQALAEQVRADIEALRLHQNGQNFGVTASIGLTDLSDGDSSPREALARADEGAYAAKAQGRNQVVAVPAHGGAE